MENVISSLHETVHLFNLTQFINIISFQPDNYSTQLLFYRQKALSCYAQFQIISAGTTGGNFSC